MNTAQVVYKLEITLQDLLDCNEGFNTEFNKLNDLSKKQFLTKSQNSIANGMNEGMDYSTVMSIVASMLEEDLVRIVSKKSLK